MPVVIIEMWEGRSEDQKRRLVAAVTKDMVEIARVRPDHLHVIIHDVPKSSWGRAGTLGSDLEPESKTSDAVEPKNVERLSHMALRVSDRERSVNFYTDIVGLSIHSISAEGAPPLTVLAEGLGITTGSGIVPLGGAGNDHIAFKVSSLEPVIAKLKFHNVPIVDGPRPSPYGNSVYFLDPDGNKVECHDGERQ